ncbi:MAG: hypothetical protein AVDCRST_MAG53-2879, partial [uncultured Solirubrobacteraceae bacterium]
EVGAGAGARRGGGRGGRLRAGSRLHAGSRARHDARLRRRRPGRDHAQFRRSRRAAALGHRRGRGARTDANARGRGHRGASAGNEVPPVGSRGAREPAARREPADARLRAHTGVRARRQGGRSDRGGPARLRQLGVGAI